MKMFDSNDFKKKLEPFIYKKNDNEFVVKIEEIEKEVNAVFSEVCQDKDFSLDSLTKFKESLIANKNILETILSDMESYDARIYNKVTKILKLKLVLYLFGAALLFVYSPASYFLLLVYFILTMKGHNIKAKLLAQDDYEFVSSKKQGVSNTIQTSLGFISKKVSNLTEAKTEEVTTSVSMLANHVIDVYFKSGELIETTKEIEEEVIKILQVELNTDICDILVLLNLAKEKINEKSLDTIKRERKDK